MPAPDFPPILTDADWQKQKGTIAKMAGETGIGAAMKKVKSQFDAVDWAKFDGDGVCITGNGVNTPEDCDDKWGEAVAEHKSNVTKVQQALRDLEKLAQTVAGKFKKNPLIPKSSREHVEKIETAADHFAVALKDNGVYVTNAKKSFDERRKYFENRQAVALKGFKQYMADVKVMVPTLMKEKDPAKWAKFWKDQIRGIGVGLGVHPDPAIREWHKANFLKMTKNDFGTAEGDEIAARAKLVLAAVMVLEKKLA